MNRHDRREVRQQAGQKNAHRERLKCADCNKETLRFSPLQTRCIACHEARPDIKLKRHRHRLARRKASLDISINRWNKIRKVVIAEEKVCRFCGTDRNLSVDHIIPLSFGGKSDRENLRLLCEPCHRKVHQERNVNVSFSPSKTA